jgi:hypothetical protein
MAPKEADANLDRIVIMVRAIEPAPLDIPDYRLFEHEIVESLMSKPVPIAANV